MNLNTRIRLLYVYKINVLHWSYDIGWNSIPESVFFIYMELLTSCAEVMMTLVLAVCQRSDKKCREIHAVTSLGGRFVTWCPSSPVDKPPLQLLHTDNWLPGQHKYNNYHFYKSYNKSMIHYWVNLCDNKLYENCRKRFTELLRNLKVDNETKSFLWKLH